MCVCVCARAHGEVRAPAGPAGPRLGPARHPYAPCVCVRAPATHTPWPARGLRAGRARVQRHRATECGAAGEAAPRPGRPAAVCADPPAGGRGRNRPRENRAKSVASPQTEAGAGPGQGPAGPGSSRSQATCRRPEVVAKDYYLSPKCWGLNRDPPSARLSPPGPWNHEVCFQAGPGRAGPGRQAPPGSWRLWRLEGRKVFLLRPASSTPPPAPKHKLDLLTNSKSGLSCAGDRAEFVGIRENDQTNAPAHAT